MKTSERPKGRPDAANSLSRARFRGKSAGNFGFTYNDFVPFRFKANEIFNATEHFARESAILLKPATMLRSSNVKDSHGV